MSIHQINVLIERKHAFCPGVNLGDPGFSATPPRIDRAFDPVSGRLHRRARVLMSGDCPTPERLREYALGLLSGTNFAMTEGHVNMCSHCQSALSSVGEDDFLRRIREGYEEPATTDLELPIAPDENIAVPSGLLERLTPGRFTSLSLEYKGGQGMLFRAWDELIHRHVAMKWIPHADRTDGLTAAARARREIRVLARLRHANIVEVFWADELDSGHRVVMEWLDGCDLQTWVETSEPISVSEACAAIAQAALGLAYAHEKKVIHRDVKPRNLFRSPDGKVKVIDFGVAEAGEFRQDDEARTDTGVAMGTPIFMSPEHFINPQGIDERSDVYSLGCVLYFLLVGRPPYPVLNTSFLTAQQHVREPVPDPRDLRPNLPLGLVTLIRSMLAKKPQDRPQTAAEVAARLTPYHTVEVSPTPAGPSHRSPWPPLVVKRSRARWWMVAFALLGVLGLGFKALLPSVPNPSSPSGPPGNHPAPPPGGMVVNPMPVGAPVPPVQPAPETKWTRLFNRKDLTGWTIDPAHTAMWKVRDGRIVSEEGRYGNLISADEYRNFRLRARVMINHEGDSGIFVRAREEVGILVGYQVELRPVPATRNGARVGDLIRYAQGTGRLFQLPQEMRDTSGWFNIEVVADGPKVEVFLNGNLTASATEAEPETGRIYLNHANENTRIEFESVEIEVRK